MSDEQQLIVQVENGNVHVIPVGTMENIANNELDFEELDEWRPIMRKVVEEWLLFVKQTSDVTIIKTHK